MHLLRGTRCLSVYGSAWVCVCVGLHGATLVLLCVRVFEAESLLGSIFLQIGELFTVDGSTTLPATHTKTKKYIIEVLFLLILYTVHWLHRILYFI